MSECGHAILSARANKLRHRSDRQLRRAHRSDSFDDDADPNGSILQHPTDGYSSDDAGSDAEAEAADAETRRLRALAAAKAAAAAGCVGVAHGAAAARLSAVQLRASYESELAALAAECRAAELHLRRVDGRVRQMNQWKTRALASQQLQPAKDFLLPPDLRLQMQMSYSSGEMTEATKLRMHRRLIALAAARQWLRGFRLRRAVRLVHAQWADIVNEYIAAKSGRSGGKQMQHQQQHQQQQWSQQHGGAEEKESFPSAAAAAAASLPSTLSALFTAPSPPLLGSLTDDTHSFGPAPLSILSSTAAAVSGAGAHHKAKVALQAEVANWSRQSANVLKFGLREREGRSRKRGESGTIAGRHVRDESTSAADSFSSNIALPATTPSRRDESSFPSTGPGPSAWEKGPNQNPLQESLACLSDLGPVLRCLVEEVLNSFGEGKATLQSFFSRGAQLRSQDAQARAELARLENQAAGMQAHLQGCLRAVAGLLEQNSELKSLRQQHEPYERRLGRALQSIRSARERREIEARKELRREAALLAGSAGATGGMGLSTTLLARARAAREAAEQTERARLLRELVAQQETSVQNAARSASAATNSDAHAKRETSPSQCPQGLDELAALLAREEHTPHLDAFLRRKQRESTAQGSVTADDSGHAHGTENNDDAPNSDPRSGVGGAPASSSAAVGVPASTGPTVPTASSSSTFRFTAVGRPAAHPRPGSATARPASASAAAATPSSFSASSSATLADHLEYLHGMAQLAQTAPNSHSATAASASPVGSLPLRLLATLPFVAQPPPPTAKAITAPPLILRPSAAPQSQSQSQSQPQPLPVATQLRGGVSLRAHEREKWRLAQSPFLRSAVNTHAQEMAALADAQTAAQTAGVGVGAGGSVAAASLTAPPSARGSRPLKASCSPLGVAQPRLPIGGSSAAITRQKLAQQKLRIEKSIYDPALFDQ